MLHSWPLLGLHEHLLEGKLPSPLSLISSPPPLAQDGKENDFNALCPQQRKEATYHLPDLETPRKKPPMMEQRKRIVGAKMEKREAQSSFNIFNNSRYTFSLIQTHLMEYFCVTSYPLLTTPVSEDRLFPPISGSLEIIIIINNNIYRSRHKY